MTSNNQPHISFITITIYVICVLSYYSLDVVFRSYLDAHLKVTGVKRTCNTTTSIIPIYRLVDNLLLSFGHGFSLRPSPPP